MTDKVGRLGSSTAITIGTHTVYTVPAGKTARGRIAFRGVAGSNSTIRVNVATIPVFQSGSITGGHYVYTTKALMLNSGAAEPDGTTDAKVIAAAPYDYYLDAGDTITVTIGTADFSSLTVQFLGAEIEI